jgi:hypothetical protein
VSADSFFGRLKDGADEMGYRECCDGFGGIVGVGEVRCVGRVEGKVLESSRRVFGDVPSLS